METIAIATPTKMTALYDADGNCVGTFNPKTGRVLIGDGFYVREEPHEYGRGDWVVYTVKNQLGRVWQDRGDRCSVCYHEGCTPAMTPKELLRPYDPAIDGEVNPNLGYNRFKESCPEYDPDCCFGCHDGEADDYRD